MTNIEQRTATELMLSHRESQTEGIESMAFQHRTRGRSVINQVFIRIFYRPSLPSVSVYDSDRTHVDGCPTI